MTKYAFVIDQRKCIGCHACTVACKAEHDVPIGVNRTWVKYIERGEFPHNRRYFLVNRCNHCDDAPCVKICPTRALYKRSDGIVDFDSSRCIGCKSCMQACPYDALYIDPNTHTAAKCNYCAHRVETGMEPACVVVCPEHAIIAGDMHNPQTEIAHIIAREAVRVRKPEQGTGPNVYYLGADEATINPEVALQELPHMTMWSTMLSPHSEDENLFNPAASLRPINPLKPYEPLRLDVRGTNNDPTQARIVYDAPKNKAPWGWMVSAYLGTKSIGAGAMIMAALALTIYGLQSNISSTMNALLGITAPIIGGLFVAITLVLLIADLKRPERALYLVIKANPTSWLVWGGYILGIFGAIEAVWFVSALFGLTTLLRILLILLEVFGSHSNSHVAAAAHTITRGPLSNIFYGLFMAVSVLVPLVMLIVALAVPAAQPVLLGLAGIVALVGLFAYEHCFVVAGQAVPLS